MSKKLQAHLALFLSQLLYAASFPIAKIVMQAIPYNVLVVMRIVGAVALFWISSLFFNEKTERKDLGRLFLLAIFGVAVNQTFFLKGLDLTSPINAAIMMITTPILVLIIAALVIKEKITALKATGIIIGFAGAAFLVMQGNQDAANGKSASFIGDVYVFLNAISWGMFLVLVKPLMKKYHTVTILKWTFLFGLPLTVPFAYSDAVQFDWAALTTSIWLYTGFVIVFTTFVAYLLNTVALNQLSPSIVSAYIYLQPLLTAMLTVFIFRTDSITWEKVASALLIFAGVYLASLAKKNSDL